MRYHEPTDLLDLAQLLDAWGSKPLDLADDFNRTFLRRQTERVEEHCVNLRLPVSFRAAERISLAVIRALENGDITLDLRTLVQELVSRIKDEVPRIALLSLDEKERVLWLGRFPFGEDVHACFPTAAIDIAEAGKCLALERSTAAVFHLMRAMEVALKVTAKALGIPYAPSWESYLKQIQSRSRIDQKWQTKDIGWKQAEPFFREALGHLQAVKVAWRNPTMHIINRYTGEQAEEVFNAVRGFIRHLATRLSEQSGDRLGSGASEAVESS